MPLNDETISLLAHQPKNAKTAIIQKLSKQWPLTAMQLYHAIKREYALNISYQAVHKALKELEKEQIVTRENSEWQLNQHWLIKQESFIQETKQHYSPKKNRYDIDLNLNGPQKFEFDNMTDFGVETAKLVANQVLCQNREAAYFLMRYGWWSFKFKFEHLALLYKLVQNKGPESIHIVREITPFGKWVQKQYQRVGATGVIGSDIPFEDDLVIQGNWVVQVHISEEGKKIIQKYWNKWKSLEDCFREFGLKEEPRLQISVTVMKNPSMAGFMKEQVEEHYKKAKKANSK